MSLSEDMFQKVIKLKEEHGFRTLSAAFHHVLIVWDQARKYRLFEKKKMKDAFWKAFDREVKAHPEWYVDDGPDFYEK